MLRGGFVWLDHAHIEAGLGVRPPAEWGQLFREPFAGTGYYRPLTALSLSIDALAKGPLGFHVTNLGLHALSAALLLVAAEALGASRRAATLGALAFAAHPFTSLVAGAIAFRSDSLVAAGLFGLIVAHLRGRALWAAVAVLVAALAKETGLVLAPLFVLALVLRVGVRHKAVLAAEGSALALGLGLRLAFAPAWRGELPELSAGQALGTRLAAFAKSAAAVIVPADRSLCDAFPVTSLGAPLALGGAALAAGLLVLSWRAGTLGLMTLLCVLPSLQLVPTLRWWSPHYLYQALGLFLVLVAERLERKGRGPFALGLAAAGVLAALSWHDGRRYRSDDTLWRPEVAREAACREGHFYLAEAARARGELGPAASHYEAALRSREGVLAFVDLEATLTNYGLVLLRQGRHEEARGAFEAALRHADSELARRKLEHDLAVVALSSGDAPGALRRLEREAARPDALRESLIVYARALELVGRAAEAEAFRKRAGHQPL